MNEQQFIEALADKEHESWGNWMRWLFQICKENPDGSVTITPDLVKRWQRQIGTSYNSLSEEEKQYDRDEVMKKMQIIRDFKVGF